VPVCDVLSIHIVWRLVAPAQANNCKAQGSSGHKRSEVTTWTSLFDALKRFEELVELSHKVQQKLEEFN
jgi:hypothetical protein